MVWDEIGPNAEEDKTKKKNRTSKMDRKKEEVRRRLTREFRCLKKLTNSQGICLPDESEFSDESESEMGVDSKSTQPPLTECRMRNPPKYLSARQVWLKKDLSEDNPYRKFFQNAKNPKWHPPWRPPSPPSGWALYQAQVDTLIDDLADWMKRELETPGYQPTATMDAEALRQMFELDLDGYAARKIKVQPKEVRCLRLSERQAKRHEKADATQLPEFLNILYRVKQMALNDIAEAAEQQHVHAFGRHLPEGHPKRGRPRRNTELDRWVIARTVQPELADWSNILRGLKNTFIGSAFSRYVNENLSNVPPDIWPLEAVNEICESEGKQTTRPRKPHKSSKGPLLRERQKREAKQRETSRVPTSQTGTLPKLSQFDGEVPVIPQ